MDCLKLIVNQCYKGSSLILSEKVHATVEFLNRVCTNIPESTYTRYAVHVSAFGWLFISLFVSRELTVTFVTKILLKQNFSIL